MPNCDSPTWLIQNRRNARLRGPTDHTAESGHRTEWDRPCFFRLGTRHLLHRDETERLPLRVVRVEMRIDTYPTNSFLDTFQPLFPWLQTMFMLYTPYLRYVRCADDRCRLHGDARRHQKGYDLFNVSPPSEEFVESGTETNSRVCFPWYFKKKTKIICQLPQNCCASVANKMKFPLFRK